MQHHLIATHSFDPPAELVGARGPTAVEWIATIGPIVALVGLCVYAFRERRRTGGILVLTLVGGSLCTFVEPFVDNLGKVWLRQENAEILFTWLGRPMPVWVLPFTALYWGGQVYLFYRLFQSRPTAKRFWSVYGVVLMSACLLEVPSTSLGLYDYFGNQPLNPTGYPLYWPFIYQSGVLVAALLHACPELFQGWKALRLVLLIPMAEIGFLTMTGLPIFIALHTEVSTGVATIAAFASIFMVITIVSEVGRRVVGQGPVEAFRQADAPIDEAVRTRPEPART